MNQDKDWTLYQLPNHAVTSYTTLVTYNNRNLSSHILEAGSSKSRRHRSVLSTKTQEDNPSLPFPASGFSGQSLVCGFVTLISTYVFTWPCPPHLLLLPVFLIRPLVFGFRASPQSRMNSSQDL